MEHSPRRNVAAEYCKRLPRCRYADGCDKHIKKCEPIFVSEGVGDKRLAGLYNNICTAALETGRSEDALYYAEKAWHIAQKVHMDGESLQKVHSNYIAARRAAEHGRQ